MQFFKFLCSLYVFSKLHINYIVLLIKLHVVGWRRGRTPPAFVRFSVSPLLFVTRPCCFDGVGWGGGGGGGINVLFRVRGTCSFLTRSWCYALQFSLGCGWGGWGGVLMSCFRVRGNTLIPNTLLMWRSALFPRNFWHALDFALCTFP